MTAPAPVFGTIVVGIDGRSGGRDAAALAERLAGPGTTIALVHAHRAGDDGAAARDVLRAARQAIGGDVVLIDRASHHVAKLLHEVAGDLAAELIVVGSPQPRSDADQPLADLPAVVHHSPCSVAVSPRGYAEQPRTIARIGVGFRDAQPAQLALGVARGLALRLGCPVHALGVLQQTPSPWRGPAFGTLDAVQTITGNAEQDLRERLGRERGITTEVVAGEPVEQLAKFAERVDLLVVGAPGRGAMRRLVVGSVAQGLMGRTPCPLLIIGGQHVPAGTER